MHHLFLDAFIILIHLIFIIRQLNKQQRIDMNTYLAISLSQLFTFLQGKAHQMLIQRTVWVVEVKGRVQYHALLDHSFLHNHVSGHCDLYFTLCLRRGRNAYLHFGVDVFQHLFCLVCQFTGKHVLLVNDNDDRNALLFLCPASEVIEGSTLFGVSYHHGIILIDTLPVDKKNLTRMDIALGGMVEVIIDDGMQFLSFRKEGFHFEVALLMKLVGSNPNICHLFIWDVGALAQLCVESEQHF